MDKRILITISLLLLIQVILTGAILHRVNEAESQARQTKAWVETLVVGEGIGSTGLPERLAAIDLEVSMMRDSVQSVGRNVHRITGSGIPVWFPATPVPTARTNQQMLQELRETLGEGGDQ